MVVAAAAIVAGMLASTGAASTGASASAAADPPSFLHILTDDQTIDSLAAMAKTEKLLVRRGTRDGLKALQARLARRAEPEAAA